MNTVSSIGDCPPRTVWSTLELFRLLGWTSEYFMKTVERRWANTPVTHSHLSTPVWIKPCGTVLAICIKSSNMIYIELRHLICISRNFVIVDFFQNLIWKKTVRKAVQTVWYVVRIQVCLMTVCTISTICDQSGVSSSCGHVTLNGTHADTLADVRIYSSSTSSANNLKYMFGG